jgi:hypothetical protein
MKLISYPSKTYAFYTRSTTYKKSGPLDQRSLIQQKIYTFYTCSIAYKKPGASDRRSLTQQKIYAFYTRSTAYKKSEAPDQWSLIQQNIYAFYTCSTTYKRPGAPDRLSNQYSIYLLLFLACASPRIKSKGIHRYVLQIFIINQVHEPKILTRYI